MRLRNVGVVLSLSCFILFATGCWDRVEIDQRGFVVGVAIDLALPNSKHKYFGTYQIVVPGGLKQTTSGPAGGGGSTSGKAYFNISTTENSMPALAGRISTKTSRSPYFEHLKMIVISQEVAKSNANFADLLDFFLRNSEMRRGVQIIISEGRAADVFKIQANNENMPVDYITSIAKNTRKTNFILPQSRIGDVHEFLVKHQSFAIQKIKIEKDQGITLAGSAIFAGDTKKMVGILTGSETQGYNFLTNQIQGGIVEAKFGGSRIDFLVERSKRKFVLQVQDRSRLKFIIRLETEGSLDKSIANLDPSKDQAVKSLEKRIAAIIESNSNKAIQKLQKSYKKDAIGLGAFLYQNHYKVWKPLEGNWDEGSNHFSQVEIEVQASVIVRRIGNINETTKG
ncbi:Ger(x)C family spore germination protein [Paenibacillus sp. GCM10027628]|uniref:Ger(x)C family spore germination protein n=1 Tax=Paenibacillus sp. GCM10027628 TaxID=3273413 RepID=UPI00363B15A4